MVTRRHFLAQTAPLTLAPWLGACDSEARRNAPAPSPDAEEARFAFLHGVASGDPLPRSVILWTRVTREASAPSAATAGHAEGCTPSAITGAGGRFVEPSARVVVGWSIALGPELRDVIAEGHVETGEDVDYTVKVDVQGLAPGTTYHYQFRVGAVVSAIGRTRTSPEGHVERWRVAVTSCANYPRGFFHAYRKIAERTDLDLVLYLGDYIYEFANRRYGDGAPLGRIPDPDREIVTLDDYRRRHAQYKLDPDLQEVHRQHPAVAVWDDHEVADNAYRQGANNHQAAEGEWEVRKLAATRAFREWLPIRVADPEHAEHIYRRLSFGDLVDLVMLDTRLVGRDKQIRDACDPRQANDPTRSLLGAEQEAWFLGELATSFERGARWRIVGQQVAFGQFRPDVELPDCIRSADEWSGYAASRSRVLDAIEAGGIDNVVILTGDAHSSWGLDIARDPFDPALYDAATGRGSLAVELIGPAVTSPAIADPAEARASELSFKSTHPHVKFAEHHEQGYFVVEVTHERLRAEWFFVSPVRQPGAAERAGGAVLARAGSNHLTLEALG